VCGPDPGASDLARILRNASRAGYRERIQVHGRVDDATLVRFLASADLLVHPARTEVTGTVIVEALASGLPVIASAACGYAAHVLSADAGIVLPEPFDQANLDAALDAATPERRRIWASNALAYAATADLSSGIERAANLIEAAASSLSSWDKVAGSRRGPHGLAGWALTQPRETQV